MNRRAFLQSVGIAGAGAIALPCRVPNPPAPLRVALIGCGHWGTLVARAISREGTARIVACVDAHQGRARAALPRAARLWGSVTTDIDEGLARARPDAAIIAVPEHRQADALQLCARRGIPAFARAPVTHALPDLPPTCGAIGNRPFQFHLPAYVDTGLQALRDRLAAGAIGNLRRARIVVTLSSPGREVRQSASDPPPELDWNAWLGSGDVAPYSAMLLHGLGDIAKRRPGWRWHLRYGNGLFGAVGPHWLAAVTMLAGPKRITHAYSIGRRLALGSARQTAKGAVTSNAPDEQVAWLRSPEFDIVWEHRVQRSQKYSTAAFALLQGELGSVRLEGGGRWILNAARVETGTWLASDHSPQAIRALWSDFAAAIQRQSTLAASLAVARPISEAILWSMAALHSGRTLVINRAIA